MKSIKMFFVGALCTCIATATLGAKMSESVPKGWIEDFANAKELAKSGNKLILIAFSGSDWCGWCVKMEKDIYSKSEFISKAKKKFVLVMIDNPRNKSILSPLAQKQNPELVSKFKVHGYPSTVIVDASEKEIRRFGGYQRDGIDAFLKELDSVAEGAGVKESLELSDEEAKKDDRFFPNPAEKATIAARESKQRRANAANDFKLEQFAGIEFFSKQTKEKLKLEKPYRMLSIVRKTYYSGNKLTGLTLAAPANEVKAMTSEALLIETCKLVRALESDLDIKFAVTSSGISFKGKKTQITVRSSKSSGELSVQFSVKK